MSRTSYRPLAILGLVAALLADVGCSSRTDSSKTTSKDASVSTSAPADGPAGNAKLFADWPTPAGALIISGEQDGYLEPCGCTSGQQGRLAPPLRLGRSAPRAGLAPDPDRSGKSDQGPGHRPGRAGSGQDHVPRVAERAEPDAVRRPGARAEDMKIGVGEALGQFLNMGDRPKVVAANVAAPGFEAAMPPSIRIRVGAFKVGITAVLDPDSFRALKDAEKDTLLAIKPPGRGADRRPGRPEEGYRSPGPDGPGRPRAGQDAGRGVPRLRGRRGHLALRRPGRGCRTAQRR